MKILLISNYLPDRQESMLRYARMLEDGLRARGHEVQIVYPPVVLLRFFDKIPSLKKWIGYIDKYLLARGYLRSRAKQADIVHVCDHSNSMYLPLAGKTPSMITCHDLLAVFSARGRFTGVHISATGRALQRWIAAGLLRARYIVSVSHKTEEDLRILAAGHPPPSIVVHHPLNWQFRAVPRDETSRVLDLRGLGTEGLFETEGYFFHIGNNSWYKNRPAVVRIFAQLRQSPVFARTRLILAGKPWDAELRAAVSESGVASAIVEMNQISNEELRALYSGAIALIFPSRQEGFGWPILEAQACGCPVITTDRPPMTEVAGAAAILINPEDPDAAAALILSQLDRLTALKEEGLKNVTRFSMDHAIDGYLEAYQHTLALNQQNGA